MIKCEDFFDILKKKNLTFFTGIPDSTFKDLIKFLCDKDNKLLKNLIACNECEAIAISAGHYLSTHEVGIVYMQNSGLGKAVNPLTSLCDPDIYSIPILLMIGWRGEPGEIDAPQHKKMGKVTISLLETLDIPYCVLKPDLREIEIELEKALKYFREREGPYAFVIKRNFFYEYTMEKEKKVDFELSREDAIKIIMNKIDIDTLIISTTGYTSRELFEYRESTKRDHFKSFYNIGSMGCASSIGLGIALNRKERVVIFDGDAAAIMQMGAFSTIGKYSPPNLTHIIFDNQAHESTGGQPTNSPAIDFVKIALACNYKSAQIVKTEDELKDSLKNLKNKKGPNLLLIKIKMGSNSNLRRPEKLPTEYKEKFMNFLRKTQ